MEDETGYRVQVTPEDLWDAALSETELETDRVNLMKEGFVTVIEEELKKLQESRIVI